MRVEIYKLRREAADWVIDEKQLVAVVTVKDGQGNFQFHDKSREEYLRKLFSEPARAHRGGATTPDGAYLDAFVTYPAWTREAIELIVSDILRGQTLGGKIIEMSQKRKLTWNKVGGLTLMALCLGALIGVWMMRQRIFLAPPLAASTPYFYIAVGSLPALITFMVTAWARPIGNRLMLVALPVFACVILVTYLVLIGPGFITDIQCQAAAGSGSDNHLDCSCLFETIEGKSLSKCTADDLSPLPLIRLIEEK